MSSARGTKVPEIIRFRIDGLRYDELANNLKQELQAALVKLQSKDELVAQR